MLSVISAVVAVTSAIFAAWQVRVAHIQAKFAERQARSAEAQTKLLIEESQRQATLRDEEIFGVQISFVHKLVADCEDVCTNLLNFRGARYDYSGVSAVVRAAFASEAHESARRSYLDIENAYDSAVAKFRADILSVDTQLRDPSEVARILEEFNRELASCATLMPRAGGIYRQSRSERNEFNEHFTCMRDSIEELMGYARRLKG
jgi:hypothetical protein